MVSNLNCGMKYLCTVGFRKKFLFDFDIQLCMESATPWNICVLCRTKTLCFVVMSSHLPHHEAPASDYAVAVAEVTEQVTKMSKRARVRYGATPQFRGCIDANLEVGGHFNEDDEEQCHIGTMSSTRQCNSFEWREDQHRVVALMTLLMAMGAVLPNTFTNIGPTHRFYSIGQWRTIGYTMADPSMKIKFVPVKPARAVMEDVRSDHLPIFMEVGIQLDKPTKRLHKPKPFAAPTYWRPSNFGNYMQQCDEAVTNIQESVDVRGCIHFLENAMMEVVKEDIGYQSKEEVPWYNSMWQPYSENKRIQAAFNELQGQADTSEELQVVTRAKRKWIRATAVAGWNKRLDGFVSGKLFGWKLQKCFRGASMLVPGFKEEDCTFVSDVEEMTKQWQTRVHQMFIEPNVEERKNFLCEMENLSSSAMLDGEALHDSVQHHVTIEMVDSSIRSMRRGKAGDKIGLNIEVLQAAIVNVEILEYIHEPFVGVCMPNIEQPAHWRTTKMIGIPKVLRAQPRDIRLVAWAPVLKKVYRKVLMQALYNYTVDFGTCQYGCRNGHQAPEAVLILWSILSSANKHFVPVFCSSSTLPQLSAR